MADIAAKNANRFTGFAEIYEDVRPAMPLYPVTAILRYLGKKPALVVDLGCGTGLSTAVWAGNCEKVLGVEPSADMLAVARTKQTAAMDFVQAFASSLPLPGGAADVVVCSQSFHWMEPAATLQEVGRVLAPGGVFAAVDCDWPPLTAWQADNAYETLFEKAFYIEESHQALRDSFVRYSKDRHLENIRQSGQFCTAREVVFCNSEPCTAQRLIGLALSQGSIQCILKRKPELIEEDIEAYKKVVNDTFGDSHFTADFCYRMRIAVK